MKEGHYNASLATLIGVLWALAHVHFVAYEVIFCLSALELVIHKHVVNKLECVYHHRHPIPIIPK